jgi:spermidine synthase
MKNENHNNTPEKQEKKENKKKYQDYPVLRWWSSSYFDYLKQEANNPENPHPLMTSIEVEVVKEADLEQILALYKQAGWWDEVLDEKAFERVRRIISETYCFVIARFEEKIVGMGRSISDGVSDAYIQDVVVDKDYRRQGIGEAIVHRIVQFLLEHDIKWIALISEPGSEDFYRKLGFREMLEYTPFLLPLQ